MHRRFAPFGTVAITWAVSGLIENAMPINA